jgi:hypothetical protein
VDRYSFLVRLFHPLLHAGLSRRTSTHIAQVDRRSISANAWFYKGECQEKYFSLDRKWREELLDFQPPTKMKDAWFWRALTAWLILFSILVALSSGRDDATRS